MYVKCKGKERYSVARIGQPLTLAKWRASGGLAKFLQVPIEGL